MCFDVLTALLVGEFSRPACLWAKGAHMWALRNNISLTYHSHTWTHGATKQI